MIKWQRKAELDMHQAQLDAEVAKEKQRRQREMDKYREGNRKLALESN